MTNQDLKKNINQNQKEVKNPADFSLPKNWVETTLGEVVEIKYGKDHKKLEDGRIPCYGSGGLMRNVEKFLYDKPSVLIPRKGTISNLFFVTEPFWTVDTLFYTKINEGMILPKFLFYKLKNENLESLNVGSAVPSLTTAVLNDFKINLPPLPQQKSIAEILSSFDDKIELLREQNQTLETIGQEIFKEWFGKYSVDRSEELPEGWRVGKITNIIKRFPIKYKCVKSDLDSKGKIPILDQGKDGLYGYTNREPDFNASKENPVLIFTNHTCNYWFIDYSFCAIQNILPYRGIDGYDEYFLYFMTKGSIKFIEYKGHWPDFEAKDFIIPIVKKAEEFSKIAKPILHKISQNNSQIQTLSKTRDTLLPKLMRGEILV